MVHNLLVTWKLYVLCSCAPQVFAPKSHYSHTQLKVNLKASLALSFTDKGIDLKKQSNLIKITMLESGLQARALHSQARILRYFSLNFRFFHFKVSITRENTKRATGKSEPYRLCTFRIWNSSNSKNWWSERAHKPVLPVSIINLFKYFEI